MFDIEVMSKATPLTDIPQVPEVPGKGTPQYKGKGSTRTKIGARRHRLGIR